MALSDRPKSDNRRPPIFVLDADLETILQDQDEDLVDSQISHSALQFALLGEIDSARELDSILWKSALVLPNARNPMLNFAWAETGKWPESIPEEEKTEIKLAELNKTHGFIWAHNANPQHTMPSFDEEGLWKLLTKDDESFGYFQSSYMEEPEKLVRALMISQSIHPAAGVRIPEGHSGQATEHGKMPPGETEEKLCDRVRLSDLHEQSASIVRDLVANWDQRNRRLMDNLAHAGMLWPLYVRGLLADALNIDQAELKARGKILIQAFQERMRHPEGPSPLSSLSIRELVELADKNSLHGAGKEQWLEVHLPEDGPPKTLMRDPASQEDISKLEARLDATLPDDLKEFLLLTNGYGQDNIMDVGGDWIHDVDGFFNGISHDPGFYGVDEIRWVEDEEFQQPLEMLNLPMGFGEDLVPKRNHSSPYAWDSPFPLCERRLQLGSSDVESLFLVEPSIVKEAQEVYLKMYESASSEQKHVLDRAIIAFAGSWEDFLKVDWLILRSSEGFNHARSGVRKYLEYVTLKSQVDSGPKW
ncbi:MAG: hypothetical protein Q9165_008407 [Trypethelium subeluteriae]